MRRPERRPATKKAELRSFLEFLVTDPECFALTKATPVQRAICRCLDGIAIGDLVNDEDVRWAFTGKRGTDALEVLAHIPVGVMPKSVILCAAIRGGKTLISAALAFRACLTIDVSGIMPNEPVRYSIVATDMDKAKMAVAFLQGIVPEAPRLRPYFLGRSEHGVVVRHPSGLPIEIRVTFGGGGGKGVIARWSAGLTADEAPSMQGGRGKSINLDDLLRAVYGRLRPGAQVFMPGSPWAPSGPIFDAIQDNWGKPTKMLVVIRATGPMLHPEWWTPQRIEEMRSLRNGELTIQTECWAEFGSLPSQFFTADDIRLATRPFQIDGIPQLELLYDPNRNYAAFSDPATRGDAWTLVIASWLEADNEGDAVAQIVCAKAWMGSKQEPLKAKEVFLEMRSILEKYRLSEVWSDAHNFDPNSEHASDVGITLLKDEAPQAEKNERYLELRSLVTDDAPDDSGQPKRISLPPDPMFRADMLAIVKELTRTGLRFPLPVGAAGGGTHHADFAPATVGAVAKAKANTGGFVSAMKKGRSRGFFY